MSRRQLFILRREEMAVSFIVRMGLNIIYFYWVVVSRLKCGVVLNCVEIIYIILIVEF